MKPIKPIKPIVWSLRRKSEVSRGWPNYLFWGRVRTSTFALIVAFCVTYWLYQTYQPPPKAPVEQPAQIVPPGFVPDPEYTWVPRTNVQEPPRTTTPRTTTTTTTTTPSPTETTPTTPVTPTDEVPTTVVDPDGPGPLPPTTVTTTVTPAPGFTLPTLPPLPPPFGPGPGPAPTTPAAPR